MPKVINLKTPKEHQLQGISKVVDSMAITIGPKGQNVCLTNGEIVNDGRRISEDIVLKDPIENKGASKVRTMVRSISTDVGGGRTACAILYKELCETGLNLLNRGFNGNMVRKGMELAEIEVTDAITKLSKPVGESLKEVATISTESEVLGTIIAQTIQKVGLDSVVKVEDSNAFGITTEIADGLECNQGYVSPYMVTDRERMEAEYKDIAVLITDKKLSSPKDLIPAMNALDSKNKKELFIIAEDFDESVLKFCAISKANGIFSILAIKTPGVGDLKKYTVEDLCALTGATLLSEQNWDSYLEQKPVTNQLGQSIQQPFLKLSTLGKVAKVTATKSATTMISSIDLKTWITTLKTRRELSDNKWEKDQYDERIAKLLNGIAVIKVGASSDDEVKYLKLKIEDGINEAKRALEEGIVIGGNVSLIHAATLLTTQFPDADRDVALGYHIVKSALESPLRKIIENANDRPDVIIEKIKHGIDTTGYNALTGEVVKDMYKSGIIDAAKVVKAVVHYAVQEAGIFLTIGGDISEQLLEEK